jgi:nitrite reductase (NADH) large subunit
MRYVIVGNGAAAVMAAEALLKEDPGATVEVYGEEPYLAYRRPQLPEFLAGSLEERRLLIHPAEWYAEKGVTVHRDVRVVGLDPPAGTIHLADGRQAGYDRLLLATGSTAFVPSIAGSDVPGFFSLRTMDDARRIREYAVGRAYAVVIGGGLLGLEAARGMHALGLKVTVVELYGWLLPRQLDQAGAAILTQIIEGLGIRVITGVATECVVEEECIARLRLKDQRVLPAEVILVSAGVRPRVELAQEAGLTVNKGVVVDSHLRTSAEGIYAAGDVAEFDGRVYGILPAVWDQAPIAVANMAGREVVYTGTVPSTTLKVVGVDLTSIGEVNPEKEGAVELRRSEPEAGRYVKLVLREGRLAGAILLGERKRVRMFSKLVAERTDVSGYAERLLDAEFTEVAGSK